MMASAWMALGAAASATEPTYTVGEMLFVETGVEAPDRVPAFSASMVTKPCAPVFEMLATQGTQGRYCLPECGWNLGLWGQKHGLPKGL